MESEYSAVVLSRGGTWKPDPYETPYLAAYASGLAAWPDNSTAMCYFYDTAGAVLLQVEGDVRGPEDPQGAHISFEQAGADMDQIPAGAGFEIILDTNDGPFPIRYGKVIRKEVFFATPLAQQGVPPLSIVDNFQRTALGKKWMPQFGAMQIVDNSDANLPYGVAAKSTRGSMRYWQEFTTPGLEIGVALLNRTPNVAAWTSLDFCADINFEMGFAVKFETGNSAARRIHIGTLSDPMTVIDRTPTVPDTAVNLDYYRLRFVPVTRKVLLYKGDSLEPLAQWADDTHIVPVGGGYQHVGVSCYRASTSTTKGIQVASFTARDSA